MISRCLVAGFRAAFASPRLVATVWLWNALLALVVGSGVRRWLGAAFDYAPESDKMLERFHVGILMELVQYDRFSPFSVLNGAVLALVVLGAISNPVLSGGILEVLVSRDERPLLHRFFRGAGHFFGRFLRLLLVSGAAALVLVLVFGALTAPVTRAIGETSWERTWLTASMLRLALLGALIGFAMAALDVARARVAMAPVEVRGMLRAWLSAAGLVLRRAGTVAAVYLTLGAVWVLVALGGLAVISVVPATSWAGILLLIVVQQAFMVLRSALRVARAAASVELVAPTGDGAAIPAAVTPEFSAPSPAPANANG